MLHGFLTKTLPIEEGVKTVFHPSFRAGVMYLYLKVPIYSQAKASYMTGLTPCFAVLFASLQKSCASCCKIYL